MNDQYCICCGDQVTVKYTFTKAWIDEGLCLWCFANINNNISKSHAQNPTK
jgi:uncharacterized protein CbrC (UPF0167 family)